MRSCAEVFEPIELSLAEVNVVSPGIGVLDRVRRAARIRGIREVSGEFSPLLFE